MLVSRQMLLAVRKGGVNRAHVQLSEQVKPPSSVNVAPVAKLTHPWPDAHAPPIRLASRVAAGSPHAQGFSTPRYPCFWDADKEWNGPA